MNNLDRLNELREKFFNVAYVDSRSVSFDLTSDTFPGKEDKVLNEGIHGPEITRTIQKKIAGIWDTDLWLPLYNGRIADSLSSSLVTRNSIVCGNEIYLTLKAGIQDCGGRFKEFKSSQKGLFSGNLDLDSFLPFYRKNREKIPFIQITAPTLSGEPVSTENIRTLKRMATNQENSPLFLDGARYSENAFLSREFGTDETSTTIKHIVRDFCRHFDVISISAKKVISAPMGGLMVFHDRNLYEKFLQGHYFLVGSGEWGGVPPHILKAISKGLDKSFDEDRLLTRYHNIKTFVDILISNNIWVSSWGMSRVTLDAARFLADSPNCEYAAQTVLCLLYLLGGIKAIGTFIRKSDAVLSPPDEVQLSFNREMIDPDTFRRLAEIIVKIHTLSKEFHITGLRTSGDRNSVLPFHRYFYPDREEVWRSLGIHDDMAQRETGPCVHYNSSFGNPCFLSLKESIMDAFSLNEEFDVIPAALERGPIYLIVRSFLSIFPAGSLKTSYGPKEKKIIEGLFHYIKSKLKQEVHHTADNVFFRTLTEDKQAGLNVISLNDSDIRRFIRKGLPGGVAEGNVLYYCGNWNGNHLLPISFLVMEKNHVLYEAIVSRMLFFMGSHEEGGLCGGLLEGAHQILETEKAL